MKRLCFLMSSLAICAVMMAQKGACGPNVEWVLDGTTLTISGDGEMYDGGTKSYQIYIDQIEHVKFEGNVTHIGSYSFEGYGKLKSVEMNDAVLSVGESAFSRCFYLTDITFSNNLQTISYNAFSECGIKELTVGKSVTDVRYGAFNGCEELRKVIWDASIPVDLCDGFSGMVYGYFSNCAISDIIVGPNAKYLPRDLFYNSFYEEIDPQTGMILRITSLTTSGNIEYVGVGAFDYRYLTQDEDGSYYVDKCLYHGFHNATPYSHTIKPGTVGITVDAFGGNNGLTVVTVPESVKYAGWKAFYDCPSLSKVIWNAKNLEYSGGSLFNSALHELVLGNTVEVIPKGIFERCGGLQKVDIPDNVKIIEENAFHYCEGLTDVKIGKGVRNIEYGAFTECKKLGNIKFSEGLDSIKASAFSYCNLSNIELPNTLTFIGEKAFYENPVMERVELPKSLEFIDKDAFSQIVTLVLNSNVDLSLAYGDVNTLIIADNVVKTQVPNLPLSKLVVGKSIEEINCGAGIGELEYNAINAKSGDFTSKFNAHKVTIGNDVVSLPDYFLEPSYDISPIILPPTLKEIGKCAFIRTGLKEIAIPSSIEKIGYQAFAENPELSEVTVEWENPTKIEASAGAFAGKPADAVLYVPRGTVNLYKETEPWSSFMYITEDGTTINKAQCATPTIGYEDRRIVFGCETRDVTYTYTIVDEDVRTSTVNHYGDVYLQQSYTIKVYASRDGMIDSASETATLYFLQASLDSDSTPTVQAPMVLIVKGLGQDICISGLGDGDEIQVYDIEGRLLASGKSYAGQCSLTIDNPAKILLIHTGDQTIKYLR